MTAQVSLKEATKWFFRGKKKPEKFAFLQFRFLGNFSKAKTEECDKNDRSACHRFGINIPCSAASFLEVGAGISLKVATKVFFRRKKTLKIEIFRLLYKAETEECDQEDWSFSDKIGIITPCSSTYHLELGAPVSLKLTTKASFGGKETLKI